MKALFSFAQQDVDLFPITIGDGDLERSTFSLKLSISDLSEIGDYCASTNTRSHMYDLRMEQSTVDFTLFFPRYMNKLSALSGSHFDDFLQDGPR